MTKFKGLLKRIDALLAERNGDSHEVTLRDGTGVCLSFAQIVKGCRDALAGVRSYEGYVISHAVSGSEYAQKWIDMFNAVKYSVET